MLIIDTNAPAAQLTVFVTKQTPADNFFTGKEMSWAWAYYGAEDSDANDEFLCDTEETAEIDAIVARDYFLEEAAEDAINDAWDRSSTPEVPDNWARDNLVDLY